ncbi:MAG TPA: twin-arginine translocase TatA/TatE family subunit [Actinomycetota bacterium]|jgi:sec-independent protein translocase protein TatA|nr:twin-arginine translocase TatA/TatE family subunit [Actinomycetota bacterium]
MPDIGIPELLIILAVVVLLFGAKKLPELARSLGRSASEFKAGVQEGGAEQKATGETGGAAGTPSGGSATAQTNGQVAETKPADTQGE